MKNEIKIRPALLKKTTAQLIKIATRHFNAFIRARDSKDGYFICISCQRLKPVLKMNAGHFFPTTKSATRFNTLNVNGQCVRCNMFLHGNLHEYEKHLRTKIGPEEFERLAVRSRLGHKWDKLELIGIIETFKEETKKMC